MCVTSRIGLFSHRTFWHTIEGNNTGHDPAGHNVSHCSVYIFIYLFRSTSYKGQKKPIFWFPDSTTDHKRHTTPFHCVTLQTPDQKETGKARLLTFISPSNKKGSTVVSKCSEELTNRGIRAWSCRAQTMKHLRLKIPADNWDKAVENRAPLRRCGSLSVWDDNINVP